MYEVMLSGAKLNEYLIVLTSHGLLSYERTMHRYSISGKGLRFLEIYDNLDHMMKGRRRKKNDDNKSRCKKQERAREKKKWTCKNYASLFAYVREWMSE